MELSAESLRHEVESRLSPPVAERVDDLLRRLDRAPAMCAGCARSTLVGGRAPWSATPSCGGAPAPPAYRRRPWRRARRATEFVAHVIEVKDFTGIRG